MAMWTRRHTGKEKGLSYRGQVSASCACLYILPDELGRLYTEVPAKMTQETVTASTDNPPSTCAFYEPHRHVLSGVLVLSEPTPSHFQFVLLVSSKIRHRKLMTHGEIGVLCGTLEILLANALG